MTFDCNGDVHWADCINGLSTEWLIAARPEGEGSHWVNVSESLDVGLTSCCTESLDVGLTSRCTDSR